MNSRSSRQNGAAPCELTDAEFRVLRDFLYERSGLFFADNKKFLFESRLHRRLAALGMERVTEYQALLNSPTAGQKELLELLDVTTTHETSFFRTQPQLDAFRRSVLPRLLEARRTAGVRTLQIWSAACSSGEEPYTLAMLVMEELKAELAHWRVRIHGTDIAKSVLEKAQAAVYTQYSFRSTPPYYLQKYFEPAGPDTFQLKKTVRDLVEFRLLNFADTARMRSMSGFQIIFCRNALIYFDVEAKRRFVEHFSRALEPGGFLFVGHSESLHGISDSLKLIHFPGAMAYQRSLPGPERRVSSWNPTA